MWPIRQRKATFLKVKKEKAKKGDVGSKTTFGTGGKPPLSGIFSELAAPVKAHGNSSLNGDIDSKAWAIYV
jgi:hypothetical protein